MQLALTTHPINGEENVPRSSSAGPTSAHRMYASHLVLVRSLSLVLAPFAAVPSYTRYPSCPAAPGLRLGWKDLYQVGLVSVIGRDTWCKWKLWREIARCLHEC